MTKEYGKTKNQNHLSKDSRINDCKKWSTKGGRHSSVVPSASTICGHGFEFQPQPKTL